MVFFKLYKGEEKNLPIQKEDGALYFCYDTGIIYMDYDTGTGLARQAFPKNNDVYQQLEALDTKIIQLQEQDDDFSEIIDIIELHLENLIKNNVMSWFVFNQVQNGTVIRFAPGLKADKVDWGDGNIEDTIAAETIRHTYTLEAAQDVTVKVYGATDFPAMSIGDEYEILESGYQYLIEAHFGPGVTYGVLHGAYQLKVFEAYTDVPDNFLLCLNPAYYGNNKNLEQVILHEGVKKIGERAFAGYTTNGHKFTSITLPDSLVEIANKAFSYCPQLFSVKFGKGLKVIGDYIFEHCPIEVLDLSNTSITDIPEGSQCFTSTLASVLKLPDTLINFSSEYAINSSNIQEIHFGKNTKKIVLDGGLDSFYLHTLYFNMVPPYHSVETNWDLDLSDIRLGDGVTMPLSKIIVPLQYLEKYKNYLTAKANAETETYKKNNLLNLIPLLDSYALVSEIPVEESKYYHDITITIKRFVNILNNAGTDLFPQQVIMGEINLSIIDNNPANYNCIEKDVANGKTNDLYTGVLNYLSGKNAIGIAAPGKILVDTKVWNGNNYDVVRDLRLFTNDLRIMEVANSSSPYSGKHLWATSFSVNVDTKDSAGSILRPEEMFKVYDPVTGTYVEQDNSMLGLVIITDKEMNYVYPTTPGQLEQSTITVESVADCVTKI